MIPSVAYTDPEVAWVGLTEDEAKAKGMKVEKGLFPWTASGRAIANGRDEGFTKLLFDAETHRIVGGGIVGTHAGDMIGEIALAIEMGADAVDIGKTIHPHPTLGEIDRPGGRSGAGSAPTCRRSANASRSVAMPRAVVARRWLQRAGLGTLSCSRCARWSSSLSGVVTTLATITGQRCGMSSPALQLPSEPASAADTGARRPSRWVSCCIAASTRACANKRS